MGAPHLDFEMWEVTKASDVFALARSATTSERNKAWIISPDGVPVPQKMLPKKSNSAAHCNQFAAQYNGSANLCNRFPNLYNKSAD